MTPGKKHGVIRRAAFQKPGSAPILMIKQWNFDWAAGFCEPLLSATFRTHPSAATPKIWFRGTPETPED